MRSTSWMVRRLTHSVTVNAPSSFALAFMNTYFLERGGQTDGAELALRFPLPRFIVDGLTLEKRAHVHLTFDHNAAGSGAHPLTISWQPVGEGPLPNFDGILSAAPDAQTTCRLTITGSYKPPGGIAGVIFDRFIGIRIANATLTALLARFANAIDADYAARSVS